jgi:Cu/Zn superoxide dismutase
MPITKQVMTRRSQRRTKGGMMTIRRVTYAGAALVAAIVSASALAASAAPTSRSATTAKLKAFLTVNQAIPAPKRAHGSGTFTATVTGRTLKFRLTYKGLTGAAAAAHIHAALAGKANPAPAVTLCGPCKNGQTGKVTASAAVMKKILGGGTYVNIHTPKNAAGEIRGQIASV